MHPPRLALLRAAVFTTAVLTPLAAAQSAPAVTEVEVTSDAGADATYALGETIEVTVRFSEAVAVTGAPGLAIDMDPAHWGEKRAVYARGSGTASLVFAHEVVEPNYSTRGIAVLADTLGLAGGAIRSASSGADASLTHTGLPHNAAHKVDWRLSPRDTTPSRQVRSAVTGPAVTEVEVTSDAGADATYALGETIEVTVRFSEAVEVTGAPGLAIDMDPAHWGEKRAVYARGSGTAALVFVHRVVQPNYSTRGIAVLGDTLSLNGGAIRSASSGAAASLTHVALPHNAAHKVDWRRSPRATARSAATPSDTTAPRLVRGEVDGSTMRLTFSEALDEDATGGRFLVDLAQETPTAGFWAAGPVTVEGAVVTVELGEGKPRAQAGRLAGNRVLYVRRADGGGGALRDLAGNPVAAAHVLPYGGVETWRGSEEWRYVRIALDNVTAPPPDTTPPRLSRTVVDGAKLTLAFNEAIDNAASLTNGAFTVKKTPPGGTEETVGLSGSPAVEGAAVTLTLAKAVRDGDRDVKVSYRKSVSDARNRLRDEAGNEVRSFSDEPVANSADTTPPRLVRGEIDGGTMILWFSEPLDPASVEGRFTVTVQFWADRWRTFLAKGGVEISGNKVTVGLGPHSWRAKPGFPAFTNYVRPSDPKAEALRDLAGNPVPDTPAISLTNITTGPPSVMSGEVSSDAGDDSAYGLGEKIRVRLTFSEAVAVTGSPRVKIDLGSGADKKWAAYEEGSGTTMLEFAYTVAQGDTSSVGIAVLANTLELNGGTIRSVAKGEDAALGHGMVHHNSNHRVDTTSPILSRANVDGATLTLTFNEALGAAASLTNGAFRVKKTPQEGSEQDASLSGTPAIGGATVTLTLANAVLDSDTEVKVSYAKPTSGTGNRLRDTAGNEVASFSEESVTNGSSLPSVERAQVDGTELTITFDKALGAAASLTNGAFRVKKTPQGGSEQDVSLSGTPAITGSTVILTLANAVLETDTDVKVSYTKPATGTGNRLRDTAGNEVASFSDQAVSTDATPPELVRGEVDGEKMTLYFSEPLDPDSVGGRFRATVRLESSGRRTSFTASGKIEISGNTVTVGLGSFRGRQRRATAGEQRNQAYYLRSTDPSAKSLRDLAGNPVSTPDIWAAGWLQSRIILLDNLTGVARLSVADARANEVAGAAAAFEVRLSRAAMGTVTVDYATADGTATAGADYTATSGTLTFAAGETAKTVSVPVLDDSLDEGDETFTLRLSNATGARIADGEATGTIANDDPLQKMWLSRFGRTVASHVTEAVSERLGAPPGGAQVTVGGQRVDLARTEDGAALTQTLTALARALGASEQLAPGDGPDGFGAGGWPGPGAGVRASPALGGPAARDLSGRELLRGSAFHLAGEGDRAGPGLAAWGRVTVGGFDGEAPADAGSVRIDGEVTTGVLGADAEWNHLLAGVALSVSEGEGSFDQPGVDSGAIESTMTAVSPYARVMLNERVSVWGLAGWGTGDMTIVQAATERGQPERITRGDLEMRLAAVGGRGALMEADESGGMDLALKADAFWVETEAEAVSNEGGTTAAASRVRLLLEGSRGYETGGGGTLTPGVELGVRHDGGDAETGTGVELGGRVSYEDPETGLSVEARVRTLVAHEDTAYREWGASGAVRLTAGERGRGLSFSLSPTWGAASSGVERLWSARDAGGLARGGEFEARPAPGGRARLRSRAVRRPVHGHAERGVRGLGHGARVPHRLATDLGGAGRPWASRSISTPRGGSRPLSTTGRCPGQSTGRTPGPEHGVMLRGAIRW